MTSIFRRLCNQASSQRTPSVKRYTPQKQHGMALARDREIPSSKSPRYYDVVLLRKSASGNCPGWLKRVIALGR